MGFLVPFAFLVWALGSSEIGERHPKGMRLRARDGHGNSTRFHTRNCILRLPSPYIAIAIT